MSIDQDIQRIALQEERLRFGAFDANTAWAVGTRMREIALAKGIAVSIDIHVNGHQLFFAAMAGSVPDHTDWIRRKRNLVQRFHRASYAVGLQFKRDDITLAEKYGAVAAQDYALAGGGFPIRLKDSTVIGTIGVSGVPQRDDHNLIIEALADVLGVGLGEVELGLDEG